MSTESKIWVLGSHNSNADRNIWWDENFQNLSDPDILIINLPTLADNELYFIDKEKFLKARDAIFEKFFHRGTIIIITSSRIDKEDRTRTYSNYDLSPIDVHTVKVPEGHVIRYDEVNEYSSYLKEVKKFDFHLNFDTTMTMHYIPREMQQNISVLPLKGQECTDNSGHILGRQYSIFFVDQYRNVGKIYPDVGKVVFLPPIEDKTDTTVNKILEILGRSSIRKEEPFPEWTNKITITNLKKTENELLKLDKEKQELETKINVVQKEKQKLQNHLKLLYTSGTSLEDAVYEAFKLLGFNDINQVREADLEDWVFKFNNSSDFDYGILEVKGSENRTSLANLTQCNKWVEDYLLENKKGKGIFVTNQHRLEEYPNSRQKKLHFEPNELDYARTRQICIIPSCVLFEAVNKALEGKAKSRADLEKLIAETNGVLNEL